jgi:hypothetical protein
METTEATGAVSSHDLKKRVERRKSEWALPLPEKTRSGLEKGSNKRLANPWSRKKITKKAQAGRGHETKWQIQTNEPNRNPEKSAVAKPD